MIEESKYCSDVIKKELWITKEGNDNLKLNLKMSVFFHNIKIMVPFLLCKNQTNSTLTQILEKYMSFTIINTLRFIDSFQFLSYSLPSLVKNVSKDGFKYLSQQFDNNILDLLKQKAFYPHAYKRITSQRKILQFLYGQKITDKEQEKVLNVWNKFGMKTMKYYHDLYLKYEVLLLADVFEMIIA